MKKYFKIHNLITLSLAIAVMFLVNANIKANEEIKALHQKVDSNSEAKLRLLGSE